MFGPIGMPELIVIFVIALLIFGPRKLPELGKSLGKSLAEFKRASNELRSTLEEEVRLEEQAARQAPPPPPIGAPTAAAALGTPIGAPSAAAASGTPAAPSSSEQAPQNADRGA